MDDKKTAPEIEISISNDVAVPKEIRPSLQAVGRRLAGFTVDDFRIKELYDPATHLLHGGGGKMVRAALVLSSAVTLGLEPEKFIDLGVAIEMLHNASLIHDDIIDGDLQRRGVAAVHVRYGQAAAILGGNANITKAIKLANRYGQRVVDDASEAALDMCAGERLDEMQQADSAIPNLDSYLEIIKYKTASLMGTAACVPAIYIGDDSAERNLREIGVNMGMSFQIRDDILESTGRKDRPAEKAQAKFRPNIVSVFGNHGKKDPLKTAVKLNNFYVSTARERLAQLQKGELFDSYLSFLEIA